MKFTEGSQRSGRRAQDLQCLDRLGKHGAQEGRNTRPAWNDNQGETET